VPPAPLVEVTAPVVLDTAPASVAPPLPSLPPDPVLTPLPPLPVADEAAVEVALTPPWPVLELLVLPVAGISGCGSRQLLTTTSPSNGSA